MKKIGLILCLFCWASVITAQKAKFVRQSAKTGQFLFELKAVKGSERDWDYSVSALRVLDRKTGRLRQEFKGLDSCPRSDNALELTDINFDGHKDLSLVEFYPAGPNVPYLVWLYNPRARQFVFSRAFSAISAPELYPRAKTITEDWRNSCCHHGSNTYRVIGGKPVMLEQREIQTGDRTDASGKELSRFTQRKLIRGKLRVVKREYRREYEY